MTPAYRRLLKCAHLAHLYLTLTGLALILFFAVTGFMLNHEDWFLDRTREREVKGSVPTALLEPSDRLAVVELLRKDYGVAGALTQFKDEPGSDLELVFQRPGQQIVVEILREEGQATVRFTGGGGLAEVMTDLHKGKTAGPAWGVLIDVVCGLLLVVSTTGLILWWSLKSRGRHGTFFILLGAAAATAVYWLCVP
jgi:hypothetical protein